LHLPFALLSDADLAFTGAMRLPRSRWPAWTLLKRLTMIIDTGNRREGVLPGFPAGQDAENVLAWLKAVTPR